MKTEIIVNPHAAAFARSPALVARVERRAAGRAAVRVTRTLAELAEVARQARRAEVERLVLCGGDGTLMAGATAVAEAWGTERPLPELVLAPGGTVATVARNFGQRAGLLDCVARAADGSALRSSLRPTLRVVADDADPRIGFIFGTGLVARFFRRYYAGGAGGYAAAARIVARVFVGSFLADAYARSVLDPLPCTLSVDGRMLEPRAYSLIVCSVVRDLGLHLLVTHRAGEDPAQPHLVASPLPPRALGPQAPRVLRGQKLVGADNFDGLVRSFEIRFPDAVGPWVLDGELLDSRSVVVGAGPEVRIGVC